MRIKNLFRRTPKQKPGADLEKITERLLKTNAEMIAAAQKGGRTV